MTLRDPPPGGPIRTKLTAPRSRVTLLERPSLFDRLLAEGLSVPVTLLCAGPGYGKSELAARVHRAVADEATDDISSCWYTLDASDGHPAVFLDHLAAALDDFRPGLASAMAEVLGTRDGDSATSHGIALLINDVFDQAPRRALLVLDDLHEIEESARVWEGLQMLLRRQPDNLHLVLVSRRQPRLEPLARLRVSGRLLELDERDLRLTRDETAALFRDVYGTSLDGADIDFVHDVTDGWVSGCQLIQQYLRGPGGDRPLSALATLDRGSTPLFDYLGTEVLAGEPPEIESLLLRSSVLDHVSGDICDHLLGREDSAALLDEAHRRRLFLQPLEGRGGWYRLHPLFRDFLRHRLERVEDPSVTQALHRAAGTYFVERGEPEAAIGHFLLAGDPGVAAETLIEVGPGMLRAGAFGQLETWLEQVPEAVKIEHPWVLLLEGRLAYVRGRPALQPFERALERFEALADPLGVSGALRGKAGAHFRLGQYEEATAAAERSLEGLGAEHRTEQAEALILLGVCASETADLDGAERYLDRALVLLREAGAEEDQARVLHNLATVYLPRGQLRRALAADRRAWELLSSTTNSLRPAILITLGWVHRLLGEYDAAREALARLNSLCERLGLPLQRCYALCLEGDIEFDTGDVDRARDLYAQAQGLGYQLGEPSMRIQPWLGLARVALAQGRPDMAIDTARRALDEAREVGYEWYVGVASTELASAMASAGDRRGAARTFDEAAALLEARGAHYDLAVCLLRQAWFLRSTGGAFLEPFAACLSLAQDEGYDHLLLGREADMAVPLLADALSEGVEHDYVARLLADSGDVEVVASLLSDDSPQVRLRALPVLGRIGGSRALGALSGAVADADPTVGRAAHDVLDDLAREGPATLRITTLGEFAAWRGSEPIDAGEWGGRRVKDLFKLLVVHRRRPVVRDVILEALWPDFPVDTALNNLNVTFSALRRVLEPWLPPRRRSSYVTSEDGAYRLTEGTFRVDADEFADLAAVALESGAMADREQVVSACRAALGTFGGEFLPENRYDDWAAIERERLNDLRGEVLELMARALADVGRLEEACHTYRELLHAQPFSEPVHRQLMRHLSRLGRRSEALIQYDECRRAFEEELGVALSAETTELYQRIREGEPA